MHLTKQIQYDNNSFIFSIQNNHIVKASINGYLSLIELKKNKMLSSTTDLYYLTYKDINRNTIDTYIVLYDKESNDILIHRRKYK